MWDYTFLAALALLPVAVAVNSRRRLMTLNWSGRFRPRDLSRLCAAYLRRMGITSYMLRKEVLSGNGSFDGPFNIRVPNDQFDKKICVFKLVLRDNGYVVGASFFRDIAEWKTRSGDRSSTAIVVLTKPIEESFRVFAETYGLAIMTTSELREFAAALSNVKAGRPAQYNGTSAILSTVFAGASMSVHS